MIEASDAVFPNNAVLVLAENLQRIDSDLFVARRPLRKTDPNQSIGVYATSWNPNEDSYEFLGVPTAHQPTLNNYLIGIEAYVKDADEERGLSAHSVLSTSVRAMLYRDPVLLVTLRSLVASTADSKERLQRFGIRTQRYSSNELQGSFLYLSVLEIWLETETS